MGRVTLWLVCARVSVGRAKRLQVAAISRRDADLCVGRWHYSGRSVPNSQVNLGVFLDGFLLGAMQFGPPMDRAKVLHLVAGSAWQNVVELNRMAFSDRLPRNSESRALSVAVRMFRERAPQVKWVLSFADGAQCGDGAIYRAAGFTLTQVKEQKTIWQFPDGTRIAALSFEHNFDTDRMRQLCARLGVRHELRSRAQWAKLGAVPIPGFMLRYVRIIDPAWAGRLVPAAIPFESIPPEVRMYRGRLSADPVGGSGVQPVVGGASPTSVLQSEPV